MKKSLLLIALMLLLLAANSFAGVYHFNPDPSDMYDLDHGYYYGWGIDHDFGDEKISNVYLTIQNVNNWWPEPNMLFMHLVDNMDAGLFVGDDNKLEIDDYYAGQGVLIDAWTDNDGGIRGDEVTLSYDFAAMGILNDFAAYAADGNVGFGFDPDCHFFNDKVQVTVVLVFPCCCRQLYVRITLSYVRIIARLVADCACMHTCTGQRKELS